MAVTVHCFDNPHNLAATCGAAQVRSAAVRATSSGMNMDCQDCSQA